MIHPVALAQLKKEHVWSDYHQANALIELAHAHCDEADAAVLTSYVRHRDQTGLGAIFGLTIMATTPQRATKLLVPLFANGDCYATDSLVEHIGPTLAPAIAELVANAAMPCYLKAGCATRDGACRQELLDRISKR